MEYSPEPRTPRTPRTPKSQSMLRASMRDGEVVLSFNTGWKKKLKYCKIYIEKIIYNS